MCHSSPASPAKHLADLPESAVTTDGMGEAPDSPSPHPPPPKPSAWPSPSQSIWLRRVLRDRAYCSCVCRCLVRFARTDDPHVDRLAGMVRSSQACPPERRRMCGFATRVRGEQVDIGLGYDDITNQGTDGTLHHGASVPDLGGTSATHAVHAGAGDCESG